MDDRKILHQIEAFVEEEHGLYRRSEAHGGLTDDERARLHTLKIALDRAWDLLDQRRALREAGRNPDDAQLRDAKVVENYRQ